MDNYDNFLSRLKSCDIVFTYDTCSFFSKVIWYILNKFSNSRGTEILYKVSHVALYIGNGNIIEMYFDGIRLLPLSFYLENSDYLVHIGRVKEEFDANTVILFMSSHLGKIKYNYLSLLIIAIQKIFRFRKKRNADEKMMICSELIETAFLLSGVCLVDNEIAQDVTPCDIFLSKKIDILF